MENVFIRLGRDVLSYFPPLFILIANKGCIDFLKSVLSTGLELHPHPGTKNRSTAMPGQYLPQVLHSAV